MPGWALDHVFLFVAPPEPGQDPSEVAALSALGLTESFRRAHPGQGTANACFCFDNAYLELLWIADAAAAASCGLARCDLLARADWRRTGASPFGIALRHADPAAELPVAHWHYRPAYLPAGMSIPVAVLSDDPRQPLLFRSPGNARPDAWTDGRAGARQQAAGYGEITAVALDIAGGTADATALAALGFGGRPAAGHALTMSLARKGGGVARLRLPDCVIEP